MTYRKKLIEVALPLEAINVASAREKSIRHGHPSTLHLWWARRPLAACRAVIFASLVDDPSALPDQFPTEDAQEAERQRLFRIIEQLVLWENTTNQAVLDAAKAEIMKSTGGNPPPLLDPFCGGGSIPLEAQRLGLEAHASDLNPVAVLITKALIEIPPKFAGRPPVNPESRARMGAGSGWMGARGLAEDVRYYGHWMRDEAFKRIGHLYPKVTIPGTAGGSPASEATVIAWLWARTVTCPNPACHARMPLVRSFWLSTKPSKKAWVEPIVDRSEKTVRFEVRSGQGEAPEGTKRPVQKHLSILRTFLTDAMLRDQARAHGMGSQLMTIVAEGDRGRLYMDPCVAAIPDVAVPDAPWLDRPLPENARWFSPPGYGLTNYRDLFTPRQLVALTTFSDLVGEAREQARCDAVAAGLPDDGMPLAECGTGAMAYADAVAMYLAFAVDRVVDRHSSICTWDSSPSKLQLRNTFARQAIAMAWDFAEGNPFCDSSGTWSSSTEWVASVLDALPAHQAGFASLLDASTHLTSRDTMLSSDPPYYDNIGYADLSDFFYVWLRRSLGRIYPDLFGTMLVPKSQELIATPYRFDGSKARAQAFFEKGLGRAFESMRAAAHSDYPVTVFYAFKQAESSDGVGDGVGVVASTGWETMLEGLLKSDFTITGTWPMRSELSNRMIASGTNALASSIVLVCRPRPTDAPLTTRREFLNALKRELPDALKALQHGNIAPVDLAQATIGPGMAVFSRYSKVLEADGSAMRVRTALQIINQALDEVLSEQEGEFDADTRWAVAWFEQFGMQDAPYGQAETLSKAKNTSVAGLQEAGLLIARSGKVRLIAREELSEDWDPAADGRLTVWEVTQHLIRALDREGEPGAGALLRRVGGVGEVARDLAYRLYTVCERKKWADEALAYNSLVIAWPRITQQASRPIDLEQQGRLL